MKKFSFLFSILVLTLSACNNLPVREVIKSYHTEQPEIVGYFIEENGKKIKVGEEKYYPDGLLEYKGDFDHDGSRNGRWEYYFNNGKLWSVGEYKNGQMNGIKEVYWPTGKMRYKGQFLNNEKSGHWIFYNPDGSILKELDFEIPEEKN